MLYAKGADILGSSEAGFAEAVNAAKQADVVIMALGEDASLMTGEAASRAHLDLPGNQQQLLEAVAATGKPVVLLVFSGRPLVLELGGAARRGHHGSMVPGSRSRACSGAHTFRRHLPERQVDHQLSARRGPGAALLQRA